MMLAFCSIGFMIYEPSDSLSMKRVKTYLRLVVLVND
jgi:hypothetical protein